MENLKNQSKKNLSPQIWRIEQISPKKVEKPSWFAWNSSWFAWNPSWLVRSTVVTPKVWLKTNFTVRQAIFVCLWRMVRFRHAASSTNPNYGARCDIIVTVDKSQVCVKWALNSIDLSLLFGSGQSSFEHIISVF